MKNKDLGQRLKGLRLTKAINLGRKRIPQREVAQALHIASGTYGSWESGRTKPDISQLPAIANYFDVSIDTLMNHTPKNQIITLPNTTDQGIVWSLRRQPETDNEKHGLKAWKQLANGILSEETSRLHSQGFERAVQDVVYNDMIRFDHIPQDENLANQLKAVYGLREVVVIPVYENAPFLFRNILLGAAASIFFKQHVQPGMKVGLAGGYSVSRMIYSLQRGECQSIEVYPLAISPVLEAVALDANSLVGALTYRHHGYDVRGYTLPYTSPEVRGQSEDVSAFAPTLRILAKARSVDIAFMGLGVVGRRRAPIDLLGDLIYTRGPGLSRLREAGAVGDILYHVVNKNGLPISQEISNLICSVSLSDLQEMVRWGIPVVVIASGKRKMEIARAALSSGTVNVLIIDNDLALALINQV